MLEKIKRLIPIRLFKALQPAYHFLMAWLAALVYGFPSRKLIVIGVTGTAGKTSTVYLIARLLTEAGYQTGFTSTTVLSDGRQEWLNDKKMTMPGRFFIQRLLRQMVRNGCSYAIVETTSEGIMQYRHRFISYDVAVFTGLYPEHIEAHGNFENYKEAKGRLFAHLRRGLTKYRNEAYRVVRPLTELKKLDLVRIAKTIIVNGDDENAAYFFDFWSETKLAYSFSPDLTPEACLKRLDGAVQSQDFTLVRGVVLESGATGTSLTLDDHRINLKILGEFNAANAAAAYAVGLSQGLASEKIKAGLEQVRGLAGKLELIDAGQDFLAMVDYSFEPKALAKLYETIAHLPHARVIHVLGSTGGGRDRSRRPLLGEMAAKNADIVIITNEDPYDEDPATIINQVAAGAERAGQILNENLFKILDRTEAIKKAVGLAENGDLVLLTGKGAEQYICIAGGKKEPWDEREVLRAALVDKLCVDKE